MTLLASRREYGTILAVSFGSLLEWYEVFLYIYWSPIIAELFFKTSSTATNLLNSFLIFMIGFWARPLGGVLFGRIGDLFGRKYALVLSIIVLIFPTLGMGLLPTYAEIGIFSPLLFALLRFLQALPSGGELPGAFCYLYETALPAHRRYMTSWGAVGSQIGIAISLIESRCIEYLLPPQDLVAWGWRLSFIVGSLIAFLGFFVRRKLHETPAYQEIIRRHKVCKLSLFQVILRNRRSIFQVIALCICSTAAFYTLCVTFPLYIHKMFDIRHSGLLSGLGVLLLGAVGLPVFGFLGDRFSNKKLLIAGTTGIALLIYPLFISMQNLCTMAFSFLLIAFIICLTICMALLPYRFVSLFPVPIRFTGVGISFNLVDGILGSLITMISLYLMHSYDSLLPSCFILFGCALISLFALFVLKNDA
ncbi:MAG: hypothetical protein RLZZ453_799 [Chlamydiota bacterium]|jgi:MHS family proline/betaine transporter-like MFS transporter